MNRYINIYVIYKNIKREFHLLLGLHSLWERERELGLYFEYGMEKKKQKVGSYLCAPDWTKPPESTPAYYGICPFSPKSTLSQPCFFISNNFSTFNKIKWFFHLYLMIIFFLFYWEIFSFLMGWNLANF